MDEGEESEIAAELDLMTAPNSLLKQLWYYVTLLVFPLLFFGITSLLVLPSIAKDRGTLAFWFIAAVFLIIAIGQGVAVHFAGQQNHMWILGTGAGLILFVLLGVFVVNPLIGVLLLLAILGGVVYLIRLCIRPVGEGTVDIVYVGGKYARTLFPGFNFIWPWEAVKHHVNIEEIDWNCPPQKIQLSPEEDVILRAVIRYQFAPEDTYIAATRTANWEESLRDLFVTTLQTVATHLVPTDFLAWPQSLQTYQSRQESGHLHQDPQSAHLPDEGEDDFSGGPARREHINTLLFEQMRDSVAHLGVQIQWVLIRDIHLMPHTLVGISAPPIMPDHAKTTNGNQVEKELVATPSIAQQNKAQSTDGRGNGPIEHIPLDREPTEVLQPESFSTASEPLPPQKLPTEEAMRKAYEQVQSGKVTDPQAIRHMAMTFEAVARDPEANQKISFDAERAAANLYKQAEQYEGLYKSGQVK